MKRNYPKTRWLALLLMALSIAACKKCKDDPPVNPCEGKSALKADFRMFTISGNNKDTVFMPALMDTVYVKDPEQYSGSVTFQAIGNYDSVRWRVGGDARIFKTNTFALNFDNETAKSDIDVVLIGYKKPDAACFPNDDGVDTVKKTFTVLPISRGYSPLVGKYLMNEMGSNRSDTSFICSLSAYFGTERWGYYLVVI